MGMFSWLCACGCGKQILSEGEDWECFKCEEEFAGKDTAILITPKGYANLVEEDYEGYGVFDGIDAYSWLARMNGYSDIPIESEDDSDRGIGIDLHFNTNAKVKYPIKIILEKCMSDFSQDVGTDFYEHFCESEDDPNQGWQTNKFEEGNITLCDKCYGW